MAVIESLSLRQYLRLRLPRLPKVLCAPESNPQSGPSLLSPWRICSAQRLPHVKNNGSAPIGPCGSADSLPEGASRVHSDSANRACHAIPASVVNEVSTAGPEKESSQNRAGGGSEENTPRKAGRLSTLVRK